MSDTPERKMQNSLLSSAKARVFLALFLIVVVVAGIAFVIHWRSREAALQGSAGVYGTPSVSSTPGAGNPSDAYVKAQNDANAAGAADARKKATAFIPTITRPDFVGNPDQFGTAAAGGASANPNCPASKVVVMYKPNPENCTPTNLKLARETGVTVQELMCQGCSCPALKMADFTVGDLKQAGYSADQLKACGFSLQALMAAGFSAADLKDAGFSAAQLKAAGFSAGELKSAGFSSADLKAAGYSAAAIKDAGFEDNNPEACNLQKLQAARAAGVALTTLREEGCDAAALKAAGFTAAQLKAAGFSAADLKQAGFSNSDLAAAGFTPAEIAAADKADAACNVDKLKQERASGVSATALRAQGCGLAALKAAGFSAASLRQAGFTAQQLKNAGYSAADLRAAGFTAAQLKAAGFSAADLKTAGYSANQLKDAGFSAGQLKDAGFSAADLKAAGFSAAQLKNAGYSATQLKAAGYDASQLKDAGFTAGQLVAAGYSAKSLRAAGFSAAELRHAGMSARALQEAGFSAAALKQAGFTQGDLLRAGFTPTDSGYAAQPAAVNDVATASAASTPNGESIPSIGGNTSEAKLAQFEKAQQAQMNAQQRNDQVQRMQVAMSQQANQLLAGWGNIINQQLQKAPVEVKPVGGTTNGGAAGGAGSQGANAAAEAAAGGYTYKAGTILFAVLDTGINSDDNSPIMAHVVTGSLKGSKLLGTFARQNDHLFIRFNLMNNPDYAKSISLNAVAIDPNTARTTLEGWVNHHYLLRYGSLFASSFLQGISASVMNQGLQTQCVAGSLFCTVSSTPLNSEQQIEVGLGQMGQAYSQHMGENFTTPPTVRLPAGMGIGVLVMSDLTMPEEKSHD